MKIGSIVMFTESKLHSGNPNWYPPIRTLGTVITINDVDGLIGIQWTRGSTSRDDCWWCNYEDVIELSKEV